MTEDQATSDRSSRGPICPNCRVPLRSNLRYEQVVPQWAELFTDAERAEAAQRLAHAGRASRR